MENNSQILARVLLIIKQRKVGKRITKKFAQFVRDYEECKRAYQAEYGVDTDRNKGQSKKDETISDNLL